MGYAILSMILSGILAVFCCYTAHTGTVPTTPEIYNALKYEYYATSDGNGTLLPYLELNPRSPVMIPYVVYTDFIIGGSYFAVIYFGLITYVKINNEREGMTNQTFRLQRQINRLMVIQVK